MDSEVEIDKMAARLARDEGWSKLKALSVLHSRYGEELLTGKNLNHKKSIVVFTKNLENTSTSGPGFFYNLVTA
jgi:hypothetical protein